MRILGSAGLETEEGTLYPLLRRLESQGLLTSEWDTEGARPRKYYVLSDVGLDALGQLEEIWTEISTSVGNILESRVSVETE